MKANWQKALRRQIEIISTIPDDLPPLSLDGEGLLRALNQILDNAIKFSNSESRIWFDAFLRDRHVWLQVKDEGIGIPESELDHVFDRFYQINGATNRRYGGMGLGLSLVREVIQRHGGSVWAESRGEGLGTTMTIALPLEPRATRAPAIAKHAPPPPQRSAYEAQGA
jgi:signal transduction histidine kinase